MAAAPKPAAATPPPAAAEPLRVGLCTMQFAPLQQPVLYEFKLCGLTPASIAASKTCVKLESEPFRAFGLEWSILVYLNGHTNADAGHISAFLHLRTPAAEAAMDFQIQVGGEAFPSATTMLTHTFTTKKAPAAPSPFGAPAARPLSGARVGWSKVLSHTAVTAAADMHLPGGCLTVSVTLRLTSNSGTAAAAAIPAAAAAAAAKGVPPPSLPAELLALLDSRCGADATLVCSEGEEIRAHAFVLSLRSPVFAAQLDPDSPLAAAGKRLAVPPDITPAILRRLLLFMYGDELTPASAEEARSSHSCRRLLAPGGRGRHGNSPAWAPGSRCCLFVWNAEQFVYCSYFLAFHLIPYDTFSDPPSEGYGAPPMCVGGARTLRPRALPLQQLHDTCTTRPRPASAPPRACRRSTCCTLPTTTSCRGWWPSAQPRCALG